MKSIRDFDLFRKIPKDLTESTSHGSVLSVCAAVFMLTLLVAEMWAFLSVQPVTTIIIDPNPDQLLRINFNITLLELPCEYAVIDVVDVLGTREENVTRHTNKWQIDGNGVRQMFVGSNNNQKDIMHDMHHDNVALHSNGVHAVALDEATFAAHMDKSSSLGLTFVNFYAPWCVWCQRLEPVWEAFAEKSEAGGLPIAIVKVDCVANANLCKQQKIQAFPLLRVFSAGEAQSPDYRGDRTVEALMTFLHERWRLQEKVKYMGEEELNTHNLKVHSERDDHQGCLLTGFLLVNRVPGDFHIMMRSKHHNINPKIANLSHIVNHLSYGELLSHKLERQFTTIKSDVFSLASTRTMNDEYYNNFDLHQAVHHYIKVVPTMVEVSSRYKGKNAVSVYQMVESSQLMRYGEDEIPEARFTYDLSPMAVVISRKGKRWYEFVTSVCALIGGTFTMVGLLSGFLNIVFKPKKL